MMEHPAIPEIVLADVLRSDIAFHGMVGDRVFHQGVPEGRGVEYPTVIMSLVSGSIRGGVSQDGRSSMDSMLRFSILDSDYGRCKEVANRLFDALNEFVSDISRPPIDRCRLSDTAGEIDDPVIRQDGLLLYGVTQTYSVRWKR